MRKCNKLTGRMTTIHERIQKMIACGEGKGPRSGHESYEMELVKPILEREVKQGKYIKEKRAR